MGATDDEAVYVSSQIHNQESDIELIQTLPHTTTSLSGPLNKRVVRKSSKLLNVSNSSSAIDLCQDEQEQDYVEITMDIQGDSVALHSVKPVTGNSNDRGEDEKLVLLGKGMEKKRSFGASFVRSASIRMKQVSQELKRLSSFAKQVGPEKVKYDRTKSAASYALMGLKFISQKTDGDKTDGGAGWFEVEKQFQILTSSNDGLLHRSLFAKCIGIEEFKSIL